MDYIIIKPESVKDICNDLNKKLLSKFHDIQIWNQKLTAGRYLSQLQFSEEVKSLENSLHELNQSIAHCLTASESFGKTIAEKESNIASLNQRLQGKLLEFEKREEVLQGGEMLAIQLEKGKSSKRKFTEEEQNKLLEMLALYNDRLSFKIDLTKDDSVLFYNLKFRNLDSKNLQRSFSVKIKHNTNTNSVFITESCPEIDGLKMMKKISLDEMDWHKFAVLMRKIFKNYAANE